MSHVSVTIAGRAYRMACDEGQEEHLMGLGQMLDGKIDQLRASFGEIGDMRLSVMAGIMVADELAEARRNIASLEQKLAEADGAEGRLVAAVGEAAQRIETLAKDLHRGGA